MRRAGRGTSGARGGISPQLVSRRCSRFAIYGGYFGAGVGIVILALLALSGWTAIHRMNAVKALLTACINGVAVIPFAVAGKIAWTVALVVAAGAMLGGYFGARIARRTRPAIVRWIVVAVGAAMTLYFFLRPGLTHGTRPPARPVERDVMRGFVLGVVVTVVVALVAVFAVVNFGLMSASADHKPSRLERWAANRSLAATIARETAGMTDPLPARTTTCRAGVKLYATDCVFCHGAADAKTSAASSGLYIHAPQLADDGVEDDPEPMTYWKIAHGIRFTAMPSFGTTLTATQMWQLAQFLAKMDKLPPQVEAQWKSVRSAAPQ